MGLWSSLGHLDYRRPHVAAGLLATGKVTVILDGMDEIHEQLRPVALRALSQQAHFRLVVLTRSAGDGVRCLAGPA
jgi:hypothetical protein